MSRFAYLLVALPILLFLYSYVGYPLLLRLIAFTKPAPGSRPEIPKHLPSLSISLPVYNEEAQIRDVIESLLALDYPRELRQIMVISDASSDGTDAIVAEYAYQGVELLRLKQRAGKTTAENTAATRLRGEIIINTDASIRIRPDAVRRLIAEFADPSVGVASGRDVSVGASVRDANIGEAGYVNYEMRVRALETHVSGIIGASGCFYAVRAELHRKPLPTHLSRDFAAALIAREHGYRAVSVDDATCLVPRTGSLQREFRRKVRTMSRGMETLYHKSHLLNPFRFGAFAWMLFSHKVCRWALPIGAVIGFFGLVLLSLSEPWTRWLLAGAMAIVGFTVVAWYWPEGRNMPRWLGMIGSGVLSQAATLAAILRALRGGQSAAWEPTRRKVTSVNQTSV